MKRSNSKAQDEQAAGQLTEQLTEQWRLYDMRTGCQVDRLTLKQVKAIVSSMTKERHADWVGWDPDLLEWAPLFKFKELNQALLEFDTSVTAVGSVQHEPEVAKEESKVFPDDCTIVHTDGSVVVASQSEDLHMTYQTERRKHKRWPVTVAAELSAEQYKVLTSTVDISEGGLRFNERIPRKFNGPFKVRISRGNEAIEVTCQAIRTEGSGDSYRARVIDESDNRQMRALITEILKLTEVTNDLEFA